MKDMSRRSVIGGAATGAAIGLVPAMAQAAAKVGDATTANPAGLRLLRSIDGVFTPPRGDGFQKFSFPNPEPSIEFGGLLFGFEIISFENNYGIDPATVSVDRGGDRLRLAATGLRWAGGQATKAGRLVAELRRTATGAIEWNVTGSIDTPIKAIKTIVRGLPRGRLSVSGGDWRDTADGEEIYEYPMLMGGMGTPFVAIDGKDGRVWGLSAVQTEVRPARFAFVPGPDGYKVEMIYEQAGWDRRNEVTTCGWRILGGPDYATVAKVHFDTVAANWSLPAFRDRTDAPEWMKHIALVMALHGEHWTGYVFNDFDRQLEILRWTANMIDPTTVMVFLTGWDARYYYDLPQLKIGTRTGGEAAFGRLVREGKKLGYNFALMFGANVARRDDPVYAAIADARIRNPYGDTFPADYVDWDGDRKGDGWMVFMNLAVASWRNHLRDRIADLASRYPIDAYFLDICGLWENNLEGDMLLGTRQLVKELAERFPGLGVIAEMQYDAQMGFIPMNHVPRYTLYPQASYGVVASFNHLSFPAPGRGSTGVHEYGFGTYRPVKIDQPQIPTITFVDDTFTDQRDLVMRDIATAKRRFAARGGRT